MKRAPRNILFAGALLIFLVVAPLLILYALGYRYDSSLQALRKTGSIVVAFEPQNSEIFLDGVSVGIQTEQMLLSGLTKSQYRVRVSKDQYESWEKVVPVSPGEVTWAQNIILFLKKVAAQQIVAPRKIIAFSKNTAANEFAVVSIIENKEFLSIYKDGSERPLLEIPTSALTQAAPKAKHVDYTNIFWVRGDNWVLFPYTNAVSGTSYVALALSSGQVKDLSAIIPNNAQIISVGTSNQVGYTVKNLTTLLSLSNFKKQELQKTYSYILKGLHEYSIVPNETSCALVARNILTGGKKTLATLTCENYNALTTPSGNIVFASQHHVLYFAVSGQQLHDIATNATEFHITPSPLKKEDKIFFGNGRELYVYNAQTNTSDFITRTESPIVSFLPNNTGTHVYYLNSFGLTAQEAQGFAPLRSTTWPLSNPLPLLSSSNDVNTVTVATKTEKAETYSINNLRLY